MVKCLQAPGALPAGIPDRDRSEYPTSGTARAGPAKRADGTWGGDVSMGIHRRLPPPPTLRCQSGSSSVHLTAQGAAASRWASTGAATTTDTTLPERFVRHPPDGAGAAASRSGIPQRLPSTPLPSPTTADTTLSGAMGHASAPATRVRRSSWTAIPGDRWCSAASSSRCRRSPTAWRGPSRKGSRPTCGPCCSGAGFMSAYLAWRRGPAGLTDWKRLGWAGWSAATAGSAATVCFIAAFKHTAVANVAIVHATAPFAAAAVAWVWMREAPGLATLVSAGLCLAGVIVMMGGSAGSPDLAGDLLAVGMTVLMASMMVIMRRWPDRPMTLAVGPVSCLQLVALGWVMGASFDVPAHELVLLAGFGVVHAAATVLLAEGVRRVRARRGGIAGHAGNAARTAVGLVDPLRDPARGHRRRRRHRARDPRPAPGTRRARRAVGEVVGPGGTPLAPPPLRDTLAGRRVSGEGRERSSRAAPSGEAAAGGQDAGAGVPRDMVRVDEYPNLRLL